MSEPDQNLIEDEAVKLAEIILGTWNFVQIESIKDALVKAYKFGHRVGFIEGYAK